MIDEQNPQAVRGTLTNQNNQALHEAQYYRYLKWFSIGAGGVTGAVIGGLGSTYLSYIPGRYFRDIANSNTQLFVGSSAGLVVGSTLGTIFLLGTYLVSCYVPMCETEQDEEMGAVRGIAPN